MNWLKVAKDQDLTIGNKNDTKQTRIEEELKQNLNLKGKKCGAKIGAA